MSNLTMSDIMQENLDSKPVLAKGEQIAQEVITFGCRLNIYESEIIKKNLAASNHKNAVVFNTCAVTKEAEKQARQAIRKFRKDHPTAKIIVTGCAAQSNPAVYAAMPEVDKVIGNEEKLSPEYYIIQDSPQAKSHSATETKATIIANLHQQPTEPEINSTPLPSFSNIKFGLNYDRAASDKVVVQDIMSVKNIASHLVSSFEGKARAFIQVQNGCDHRCTFCIIPYGRGNSRSVPIGAIVKQLNLLVEQGYNEVVLTGVDVTAYGPDLPGAPTFAQMLRRVLNQVPQLKRLRLSSIDVAEIDHELFELMANHSRIMPHFHISLQAGDDMILKRMKRRHNRQQILDFCHTMRKERPDVAFGADIIAGFPTETDEMFENTRMLIAEADLQYLHVFPYSEREGTPAARMPQVAKALRKERAAILRAEGDRQLQLFWQRNIDREYEFLVQNNGIAHSENFIPINITEVTPGTLIRKRLRGISTDNKSMVCF